MANPMEAAPIGLLVHQLRTLQEAQPLTSGSVELLRAAANRLDDLASGRSTIPPTSKAHASFMKMLAEKYLGAVDE